MKWYTAFHKKRTWILLLIPISFIILWVTKNNIQIAEYFFAQGIYRWISQGISLVTNLLPFSIMELEILILPIITLVIVIRFFWKLIRKIIQKQDGIATMLAGGLLNMACVFSVIFFLYVNLAGVNYYRYSFSVFGDLYVQNATVEELFALSMDLASDAADLRVQLQEQEDEYGVLQVNKDNWRDVSKMATKSFEKIADEYPILAGNYGSPKAVFFSEAMSRMEINGIYWPFTMEANVNIAGGEYAIPAAMSHELAHLRGFMREDEANFISYLVCRQSDSLEFQYSGTMLALTYASSQLYQQDQRMFQEVLTLYNEGMKNDLVADYYYWKKFEDTVISTVSSTMNDTYLKANNQHDGIKSYGRMVDLLLADHKKNK